MPSENLKSVIYTRPYESGDRYGVIKILKESGLFYAPMDNERTMESLISQDPYSIIVTEVNGEIAAVCYITGAGDFTFLWRFAVAKIYRKIGLGSAFLRDIEKRLKEKGCRYVSLFSRGVVSRFWKKNGYELGHAYHYMGKTLKKR